MCISYVHYMLWQKRKIHNKLTEYHAQPEEDHAPNLQYGHIRWRELEIVMQIDPVNHHAGQGERQKVMMIMLGLILKT